MAQILASKLRGIGIVTDKGLQVGKLYDILVDESNGRIMSIIISPLTREALGNLPRDKGGNVTIPFSAVMAIRDYIVVNERVLAIQQIRTSKPSVELTQPKA